MTKLCTCGSIMNFEIFSNYVLYSCENCFSIKYEKKPCEHEWTKLKVKISNGSYQGRQACKICYDVDPKIYKLKDFIDSKETILQSIYDYRIKLDDPFWNRLKYLQIKPHESFEARYTNYLKS
jgi:hypothetical protein